MNSEPLAAVVGLIYLAAATLEFYGQRYGYGVMWLSYGTANIGMILSMRGI